MPIPADTSECIRHFSHKGRPQKQAVAICLEEERRRKREAHHEALRRSFRKKET